MNIVIIEDEVKTAKALGRTITEIKPDAKISAYIQSIETAVNYLRASDKPDLIFMDIQLADGLCFEIFKKIKIVSPIVFCTAFDDYALEAFKANGIDYVLKPFTKESIMETFEKLKHLKSFFQEPSKNILSIEGLLKSAADSERKKSFLVFKANKYSTVSIENIAFFYIRNETCFIKTFDKKEFSIPQSLDEIYAALSNKQFFRLNRQYLVNFEAIKEVEPYFARKLLISLVIDSPEKLFVGKDKATTFLKWLEDR